MKTLSNTVYAELQGKMRRALGGIHLVQFPRLETYPTAPLGRNPFYGFKGFPLDIGASLHVTISRYGSLVFCISLAWDDAWESGCDLEIKHSYSLYAHAGWIQLLAQSGYTAQLQDGVWSFKRRLAQDDTESLLTAMLAYQLQLMGEGKY